MVLALTPVEIIATIFIVFGLVKLITIMINKKGWYDNVVKPIYGNPKPAMLVLAVLAVIIFYYLVLELSLAQIFAVIAFMSALIGFSFLMYPKEVLALAKDIYIKKTGGGTWALILVWLVLMIWALYEIFLF